jgi:hypothetical protein
MSKIKRNGYLILSEYGNIGGFFANKSDAESYYKHKLSDEKGYYIFECDGTFEGKFFME